MSLIDVKHQPRAQIALQRAMAAGRVHHAYIFHGPDGVGKETAALGLAEVLLCGQPIEVELESADADEVGTKSLRVGCGTCHDCRALAAGSHPDLHHIYRQLGHEHPDPLVRKRKALKIGVDVIRHFVIDRVAFTSARGRAKMFVIREADRITPEAQNAMLKTLEQPPGATVIVLLVSALDRLLPTTLSRCQVVPFGPLPTAFVRRRLAELMDSLPEEQIDWYARCSDGSLGAAMRRAEHQLYETNLGIAEGLASLSGESDRYSVERWTEESKALGGRYRKLEPEITDTEAVRRGLKTVFQLAATCYADVLRIRGAEGRGLVNIACEKRITKLAGQLDAEGAADAINRIARAERQLDMNVNTQLVVETLLSELAEITITGAAVSAPI